MTDTRFHTPLKTKRLCRYPGDQALELTAEAIDAQGRKHSKGTQLVPQCGGWDNTANSKYVDVRLL